MFSASMIRKSSLSDYSNSNSDNNDEEHDTVSIATSEGDSVHGEVVLAEDPHKQQPSFGNIAVKNSTDIHFGNKTYYQGPVTIKQILYANSQNSSDDSENLAITNNSLVVDGVHVIPSLGKANSGFVNDDPEIRIKSGTDKVNAEAQHASVVKGTRWLQKFSRQHILLITSLAAVLVVSLVTLLVVLLTRHSPIINKLPQYPEDGSEQDGGVPPPYPTDSGSNLTDPMELRIILRSEWLAKPSKEDPAALDQPVPYVIIMHSASESCSDLEMCKKYVREIQSFHADGRGWDDIGYSFLVGGDGYAYEGRGWYIVGAQVYGYNTRCIGIAFIGTFNQILPPQRQLTAAKLLIERGLNLSVIAPDYKLLAARQLQTTQSPGETLYKHIKTWDHWSSTP